ncbi:MAG: hypothetical protein IPM20_12015 [Gammaproteobacteria bacterium]|nr:hypothetical protein [Gammaproteobacteria bacterium]
MTLGDEIWFRVLIFLFVPSFVLIFLRYKNGDELARIRKYLIVLFSFVAFYRIFFTFPQINAGIVFGAFTLVAAFFMWNRWLYEELFLSTRASFTISYKVYEMVGLYLIVACLALAIIAK